jgi:hypothetical protein
MDKRLIAVMLLILALAIIIWDPFYEGRDTWAIGIYKGQSPFNLSDDGIPNPVLTAEDVTDADAAFVADPFMVKENGSWFMFFEVYNKETDEGDIALATSKDGTTWEYEKIVLDEPFHLSYPHAFKVDEEYYMVPESEDAGEVRLYRATGFPDEWAYEATLLGKGYRDSTLFHYDGTWYMFTTDSNDMLYLFYSDELDGPWLEHPENPIVEWNANIARPGGRVLLHNDLMIRFAQDDWPLYGNSVRAFEILHINKTDYEEIEYSSEPLIQGDWNGWNWRGMHHYDVHQSEDGWIAAVDGH